MKLEEIYGRAQNMSIYRGCTLIRDCKRALEYLTEDQLTKEIVDRMCKDPLNYDPILENLQTHDYHKLETALKKLFPDYAFTVKPISASSKQRKEFCRVQLQGSKDKPLVPFLELLQNSESKEFKALSKVLEFYNYSLSEINPIGYLDLEPIYPESGKEYISQVCHNIVYHVCPREVTDQILRQGLKCKTGSDIKGSYRDFPKRIYVFALDPGEGNIKQRLKKIAEEEFGWPEETYSILKCKVIPGNFYIDTAMTERHAYFTYNTIPPENIELL